MIFVKGKSFWRASNKNPLPNSKENVRVLPMIADSKSDSEYFVRFHQAQEIPIHKDFYKIAWLLDNLSFFRDNAFMLLSR